MPETITPDLLLHAVRERSVRAVHDLLDQGGQTFLTPPLKDPDHLEPDDLVTVAVHHGRIEVLRLLLARGGDPNGMGYLSSDPKRRCTTPLHRAVQRDEPALVEVLLDDPRTNVNRLVGGRTALHLTATMDSAIMVKRLLAAGADPLMFDPSGNSGVGRPIESACEAGSRAALRALLDHGPDVQALLHQPSMREFGPSLLMLGAWFGHAALVNDLLRYGANLAQQDSQGCTVMEQTRRQIDHRLEPSGGPPVHVMDVLLNHERQALTQTMVEGFSPDEPPPRFRL